MATNAQFMQSILSGVSRIQNAIQSEGAANASEDLNEILAEVDRIVWEAADEAEKAVRPIGTRAVCDKCGQDVEWWGPEGGWRDRGNNTTCAGNHDSEHEVF